MDAQDGDARYAEEAQRPAGLGWQVTAVDLSRLEQVERPTPAGTAPDTLLLGRRGH